ncbi:tRNA modification GTPase MnmE [Pseudooctadecabacter jejudonensis]|uniref:tRNA modification GTPase MnmE n=2 Tax=Pseudooctadecabacter jejudonensis TaxID=1391910 RepID=A0A1Y5SA45_9RHOB|nr:tRNA modification GTPase MnmE [Pseudooctadecabacter jejudonensis]
MAEPGEFTRRAMESGTLDLAQVEGLADLIDAETEGQRRQALRVFQGDLGGLVDGWRTKLIRAAALLEATIDFVDEDVPVDVYPEVSQLLNSVLVEIQKEADGVSIRERIRDGFEVALVGPPNAGKSTLLNKLAGRDAAMTSDIAGTTRDVIEVKLDLNGLPVTILDTAGLRTGADTLEEMGIERGQKRASLADIRVHLSPSGEFDAVQQTEGLDLFVQSKSDHGTKGGALSVSSVTGEGIDELLDKIISHLAGQMAHAGVATRQRHKVALQASHAMLRRTVASLEDDNLPVDLISEDLRQAIRRLDSLIGRIDVENLLDEIFSSFCIGK